MRNTFLFLLLCCFTGGILSAQSVTPWLTSGNQSSLLAQQPTVNFGNQIAPAPATITLNADNTFQSIDGFGYTLTQGSAFVISQMNSSQRSQLLNELYGPNGMSMEIVRIGIGATDLGATIYTYNETVGDVNMDNFSLEGPDLTYLVPVLQEILAINPDIKVWPPPGRHRNG